MSSVGAICSAATQRVHDLDAVALPQDVHCMARARNDLAIYFHRNAALGQAFKYQQGGQGAAGLGVMWATIQFNVHAAILQHSCHQ